MGAGVKCVITGANIKALGRAIHSLSRIGEELYFEPLDDGLCLRSVNSSRSAYACFNFAPLFFHSFEVTGGSCHCKIYMKSVVSVFRSLPSLEKTVEKCLINLNTNSSRLVIQLFCKYGVTKTHNLSYQDCESLQAVYNPDTCPNVLRAPARSQQGNANRVVPKQRGIPGVSVEKAESDHVLLAGVQGSSWFCRVQLSPNLDTLR